MQLEEARAALDRIDGQIAALFCERMAVIDAIADLKKQSGAPVRQPAREAAVLDALTKGRGHEQRSELRALYERIFDLSRARQRRRLGLAPSPAPFDLE